MLSRKGRGDNKITVLNYRYRMLTCGVDGFGPASQTMARDYVSLLQNGENPDAPVGMQLAADKLVCLFSDYRHR